MTALSRLRRPRGAWSVGVPVVAVLAGFLFAATATTAKGTDLRADRRTQVSQLITAEQQTVAGQQQRLARLHAELAAAGAGSTNPAMRDATASIDALRGPVGLTAMTGPGVTVALDDAPYSPDDPQYADVPPDYLVVHQQDVQAVVNALWAGGAKAMTIMGNRVIATTTVRCVGNTLYLAGHPPYSPPFKVAAIGDPAALTAALDASRDVQIYKQYVDAYQLGYSVAKSAALTLPAYKGPIDLSYATVTQKVGQR